MGALRFVNEVFMVCRFDTSALVSIPFEAHFFAVTPAYAGYGNSSRGHVTSSPQQASNSRRTTPASKATAHARHGNGSGGQRFAPGQAGDGSRRAIPATRTATTHAGHGTPGSDYPAKGFRDGHGNGTSSGKASQQGKGSGAHAVTVPPAGQGLKPGQRQPPARQRLTSGSDYPARGFRDSHSNGTSSGKASQQGKGSGGHASTATAQ